MKTIWKFEVKPDRFTVEMPQGADVLCVQLQDGKPFIWALCDSDAAKELRTFASVGTGHDAGHVVGGWKHIGTFQMLDGALVFHLFELGKSGLRACT